MAFVSATRLHVRSWWYLPPFMLYGMRAAGQARKSLGFKLGALAVDAQGGRWTITIWDSDADMRAFRNTHLHLAVMSKLPQWCHESSFAHWKTDAAGMPSMEEAHRRLRTAGRTSMLNRPSAAHLAGLTVSDGLPRVSLNLQPALRFGGR